MQNDQTNASTTPNPAQPTQPSYVVPKSSTVAGILGIFLGSFGAHDWYLGDNKKGILHVALFGGGFIITIIGALLAAITASIPLIGILFGLVAMLGYLVLLGNCIWGLIEGIIILSQGDAGLAAKGYPIAVPQVYVQNPTTSQTATQPTQPTAPAASATNVTSPETSTAKSAEAKTEDKPETKSETKEAKVEKKSGSKKSE